jgi:hypothetical protein
MGKMAAGALSKENRCPAADLERNHSERIFAKSFQCGFSSTPTSRNRSLGTPERKKPLGWAYFQDTPAVVSP